MVLDRHFSHSDVVQGDTKTSPFLISEKLSNGYINNNEEQITLLAAAVHSAHDSIVITTTELDYPGPEIVFVNKAFSQMTGYQPSEIIGKTPRILQGPNTDRKVFKNLKTLLRNGQVFFGEAINYRKDGTEFYNQWHIEPITNSEGELTHYLAIQRDVTDKINTRKKLIYDAFHDSLTGLHNRAWFLEELQNCLKKANEYQDYVFALLFLDLDGFKLINDSLGHSVGDIFLQDVAQRITNSLRDQDKLARLGGDEFTIIIDDVKDLSIISEISDRIQNSLQQPLIVDSQEIFTSGSIGITLSTMGYESGEEMVRDADLAMYRAKSLGKSRSAIFNKTMHKVAVKRLNLENDLRKALEKKQFETYYQPIVNVADQSIVGFESLLRWHHPEQGFISPVGFIPLAEETGLIVEIGEWVLHQACIQSSLWKNLIPFHSFFINVNLSPRQFKQSNLVQKVEEILQQTQCDRHLIKLEITESAILETDNKADTMLNQLKELGIKLCIDDFGTGYSSLSRLYQLPIDILKIDACFIRAIGKHEKKEKILESIVNLAHNLDMEVVAEGVETEIQFQKVKQNQCEYVQGYLFGRPTTSDEIEKLLRKKYLTELLS
ncbi:bifunctional diguanylate cyclase/phosphodiesterase [Geminocystis sp. NIES-3709]|uniref:putative bifunctional diguanylate cyclase/phosphodiesterase n=1 Tax=Geminocystis sp. NIES-3709 TaxID=1617448 RepID=UPI0005FCAEEF|nr:GGDEF domain-containing phosphodiesterase [Geminocystis sp. NIES-3709]BAQ66099.1 diguanylate cyclase/phosphodiesterase with PAS/PAC sensor [Geminocystis sp. NIES-3709]